MSQRTRFLKEPLLHFLVIGAALFGAYAWLNRDGDDTAVRQVRLAAADVAWLKETFALERQRDPTQEELRGLVRGFVQEQLLAREAQERGLDKDDIVVRRRLAQKMTFLLQDNSPRAEPSEQELRRFYEAQQDQFQAEPRTLFTRPRISFTQIFFGRDQRADAAADARQALQELSQPDGAARIADLGDRTQVASEIRNADERSVANQFGARFAAKIFDLAPGLWHGPIESSRGFHLVRVTEIAPARLRSFEDVREQVLERWHEQRRRDDEERYFVGLLKKYRVVPDDSVKALVGPLLAGEGAAP